MAAAASPGPERPFPVTRRSSALERWGTVVAGAAAMVTGGLWLGLWLSGTAARWSAAGAITPKTNTALGLMAAGAALVLLGPWSASGRRRAAGAALGTLVSVLGVLTLSEHLLRYDLGIDQLLTSEPLGAPATASPNRMGPLGATSLALVGAGLVALYLGRRRIALGAGLATCAINLVPATGLLYGVTSFYDVPRLTGIAWPTVVALLSLGLGLIVAVGEDGPLAAMRRRDPGGALLRRVFPLALLIPFVLGLLVSVGVHQGLLDPGADNAMLVVASLLLLSALLWRNAAVLSHAAARQERATAALRESEERLGESEAQTRQERDRLLTLINGIRDEVWFVDASGKLTLVNAAVMREFRLAGQPLDAQKVATAYEVLRGDGTPRPTDEAPPFRALRGETLDGVEEIVRTPATGQLRRRMVSAAPVRDAAGSIIGSVSVVRDVTAQKETEDALRASEQKFRTIVETAAEGIVITRPDGTYTYVNQRMADMLGCPAEEILGRSSLDFTFDAERPQLLDARNRLAKGDVVHGEAKLRRKDGAALWSMYSGSPMRNETGEHVANLAMHTDITERKLAQQRLATIARLYEVLSRANETIVRTTDEQQLYERICRIVAEVGSFPLAWIGLVREREIALVARYGSAADYLHEVGIEGEALGERATGTCVREDRAAVADRLGGPESSPAAAKAALRFGLGASAAFPLHRGGRVIGALTIYAHEAGAFDTEQLKLLGALCADVSYALDAIEHERLRAETERALRASEQGLRDADRQKNDFMAVLSHELRNPLAPIRNSLYVLDHAAPGGEQARRALAVIGRQVSQLAHLVDDLLDVTRIARNKIELRRQRLDVNALVQRAVEDHRSLFEQARVGLEFHAAPEPSFVNGDWNRLSQVVGNLLQNAAKFTARGGRVTATVSAEAGSVIVRVSDSGVGMAPETLAGLFRPFVQADETLDRSKGGLGLGLALVKGVVELHGGGITAHSAGIGRGSEFEVRLPMDLAAPAPETHDAAPRTARRCRVLVIEDNVDAADSLRDLLEMQGHDVSVAYSGPQGIAQARELRPEIIVCDIGLPVMDGYEVVRALRADEAMKRTHIVALSGYALPDDRERALSAGFDGHLAKPATKEMFEQLLASLR